ncbi:MAG: TnsA endonuclease N-terminal domain-containing protein [Terracidiphilus sp.]
MFQPDDLSIYFQRLGLAERAHAVINQIRLCGPSRRVGGGRANVTGRYPSRKMGVTIQFESHRVELAGIYEMEHDECVLEYYDQPPAIKLDYESANGNRLGVYHTPDFFVLRNTEAGWEEWKTKEELKRLSERNPNRYCPGNNDTWLCPPGRRYAENLGLYYRVRSSAEINVTQQRNLQFLEDYLRCDRGTTVIENQDFAVACVAALPGLTLDSLLQMTQGRLSPDCVFTLIATGTLHVDLCAAPLVEPSRVHVFPYCTAAEDAPRGKNSPLFSSTMARFHGGSRIAWDGRTWEVGNVGENAVGLISSDQGLVELPVGALERLLSEGRVHLLPDSRNPELVCAVRDRLVAASADDLRTATNRHGIVVEYLESGNLPASTVAPARTLFRWVARFRRAESAFGCGFAGLLPQSRGRGNRNSKLPESSLRLMQEHIETDYEALTQKTKYASWATLKLACEAAGAPTPSYKTFCRAIHRRPILDQTLKRKGRRAAYRFEVIYWTLDLQAPRHGDRPFEIGHIDHTELDIELRCRSTGQNLGRPWMTLLLDAYSRRILGLWLTFDPPSYRSCMMVIRDCVRRHSRLPQVLVVDGGREFDSVYFESLLARYELTKKTRPPAKARFGSVLERLFGTCNSQFIHNLGGNTQITREVRQVTVSVDPKRLATWSLADLNTKLTEYLFDVYDQMNHPALGQSPRDAFVRGRETSGLRLHRMIPFDQDFLLSTMPSTPKGTAKVSPGRGIKIHQVYYWSDAFRDPDLEFAQVPVRYDPFDAGKACAFCRNRWVECHSEQYMVLRGRSEREIMLATAELRRQHGLHSKQRFRITAKALASFLQSVGDQEDVMLQRIRDREDAVARMGEGQVDSVNEAPFDAVCEPESAPIPADAVEIYGAL